MAPLPSSTPPLTTSSPLPKPSSSFADRTDRLLKSLGSAASEHPLLKPLLNLHSQFRTLFQESASTRCDNTNVELVIDYTTDFTTHEVNFKIPRVPQSSFVSTQNFAAILPGDSVAGLVVANGINNFLNIYNTVLVVRLVLTWFPNSPPAIVNPLSTICDPYLNIFRGIIPPLGGLDLSPILAFLVLNVFTSTAAALPAELPASQQHASSHTTLQNFTATQEKWAKRLSSRSSKN